MQKIKIMYLLILRVKRKSLWAEEKNKK